ncbi:3-dehydroquinate synthase [Nitrosomonas oligotropha]|uniref:Multifunctional fusion protein n=2 Tax=Nitrosomonas oligotropha TaxID=42354 RepID=A0A1H8MKK6_9PROT|nr:3-dehydroquinate synthase [Nitrosomonas oligotropha]SEO17810.1 3-dehydroquinate synthase [Nitrosomonas oligotropha]
MNLSKTKILQPIQKKLGSTNIILVGMMGAGKTTIGKALASSLDKEFVDSDHEIQERTGVKIPVIFEIEGEAGFRKRESEALLELSQKRNIILATGGGAILNPENRQLLKRSGIVIYLRASVNDLYRRTRHDKNRPLLQTQNLYARLNELYVQRDALYRETAHVIIDSGKQGVRFLVQKLINKLISIDFNTIMQGDQSNIMQTIMVDFTPSAEKRSYPIHIGHGILQHIDLIVSCLPQKRVAIVSNSTVAPLYLEKLQTALEKQGVRTMPIILPDGETHKNWETLNIIFDALLKNHCERNTTILALGGGVVGDLTGFAAATYLRGVPFIQIPTTLLAQVDSSVGGKTGINHPLGKNMIGAFYQPLMVLADSATLNTLPDRELRAGLAEVIKYGLIRDPAFFDWLEQNMHRLLARDPVTLNEAIQRSCENKAEIVAADEKEKGIRALLNLGHTFGHAIENGMGYGVWLHGEAVAAGTVMAAELSRRMKLISEADVQRIRKIFIQAGLPVVAPEMPAEKYLELMLLDKKVESGKTRFIVLNRIGEAVMRADITPAVLNETILACMTE